MKKKSFEVPEAILKQSSLALVFLGVHKSVANRKNCKSVSKILNFVFCQCKFKQGVGNQLWEEGVSTNKQTSKSFPSKGKAVAPIEASFSPLRGET